MSDDVMRVLGQIEGKLDGIAEAQKDHGERLHAVEGKVNGILGWAAGAGAAAGGIIALIKSKLGGQ